MDGHDVIVHAASGPAYNIHAGYVVAPRMKPVQRGTRVMVPYRAQLRHATVQRQVKNQIVVRYGDVGVALGDQAIAIDEVGVLGGGLEPGAYALARHEHGQHLVLLVSLGTHADGARRWLVLGPEGEARILDVLTIAPGRTATELVPTVYGDVPFASRPFARMSLLAHLEKLEREGRVLADGGGEDARYT